jgi:CubicO group peptidase (beta-lactamase class C family)
MIWLASGLITLVALAAAQRPVPTDDCPILGPSFPSDFNISDSGPIQDAIAAFPIIIENLFESGALNETGLLFHIDVFSAVTNESIYRYAHSGESLQQYLTTGELNDDTVFRVGSVSKLHTVYAILAVAGMDIFNHPVTQYLPELAGNVNKAQRGLINWEEVTVGALASQQGGAGGFRRFPSSPLGLTIDFL